MRRFRPVTRNAAGAGGEVTLIWGLAEADVISVEASRSSDDQRRRTSPSPRGGFVMAFPGLSMGDTIVITATRRYGSTKTENVRSNRAFARRNRTFAC